MTGPAGLAALSTGAGVRIWCPGRARTKGSLKPVHIRKGRGVCAVGLTESGEHAKPWKLAMIKAIRAAVACERWPEPVEVHAFYRFAVGPSAEHLWPVSAAIGDEDKLRRCVLDALTQSGLILDDRLVVGGRNYKRWCAPSEEPGVLIIVAPAPGWSDVRRQERHALSDIGVTDDAG